MILITGGAGYIGSHTVIEFIKNGFEIVIFDNLENGQKETIDTLQSLGNVSFFYGDLRKQEDINSVFKKYKIDAVIHFAAFALVEESVSNPAKYYRNNVVGTLNLLDAMTNNGVNYIVFSSTCATYGEPQYTPIDENHPQNPVNPYGASKLMVERIMKDYDASYGIKSVILRYFNVAGADEQGRIGENHEPETHLIPCILKSVIEQNQTFKIYGDDFETPDGTCIRDYVNVTDLAIVHRLAYEYLIKTKQSNIFNVGTEKGHSVKEVFDTCSKVLNKNIPVEIVGRRSGDPSKLYSKTSKIKEVIKWEPQKTLKDSIETAYNWLSKIK